MVLTGSTFWQCLPKQKRWEIAKEYPKPRSSSGCLHSDAKHEGVIVKCPLLFGPYSHSLCLECLNFIWDCEEPSFVSAALFLCWRNLLYEVTSACMTYPHTLRPSLVSSQAEYQLSVVVPCPILDPLILLSSLNSSPAWVWNKTAILIGLIPGPHEPQKTIL